MDAHMPEHWGAISYAEIHALAERYGTPLYLYDADAVNERIRSIRDALEQEAHVYFAVKANPNLELLRAIGDTVDGLDVSSGGEIEQALLAGFDGARLSYAGPGKTPAELALAIDSRIGSINVESPGELIDCAALARKKGLRARVMLRVNPLHAPAGFGLKMGGRAVQFGIDEEELESAVRILKAHEDVLDFRGVHIYAGSQCFDAQAAAEGIRNTLRIVAELETHYGLLCRSVNLGGGFGVSHGDDARELDLADLARAVVPVLRDFRGMRPVSRHIVLELGRYVVAHAGLYVTRALRTKDSRGKSFCVVDGGLHHHLSAAGTFGAALRGNYALRNLSRPHAERAVCTIAGSSCNPTDLLGIDLHLPRPQPGDLIGVMKSGAYGMTASPLLFLGRPTATELVRRRGEIVAGRSRKTMTEFN